VSNSSLLGKVYFHRLAIPISIAISNLITLGIQLGIFLVCFTFQYLRGSNVHFTRWILLTPFFLLILAGYGLGGGIIVSALTTRYRDLANLVTFGVTLAMYGTPVIYPLSMVPAQFRWLMQLNPLAVLMEGFRLAFLGVGNVDMAHLAASFGIASRNNGLSDKRAREAVLTCVRSYREHMAEFSEMGALELWYHSVDADKLMDSIEDDEIRRRGKKRIAKAMALSALEYDFPKLADTSSETPSPSAVSAAASAVCTVGP